MTVTPWDCGRFAIGAVFWNRIEQARRRGLKDRLETRYWRAKRVKGGRAKRLLLFVSEMHGMIGSERAIFERVAQRWVQNALWKPDEGKRQATVLALPPSNTLFAHAVVMCDAVCVCTGPWGCKIEDWFETVNVPMEGIKSTSVVWAKRESVGNDGCALFCNEDSRFDTHMEVYPRPNGEIYT